MIITERFLATHKKPQPAGRFCWRFYSKGNPRDYYELNFLPARRLFTATRVQTEGYNGQISRALPDRDAEKLRRHLPEDEIVACTMASLGVSK